MNIERKFRNFQELQFFKALTEVFTKGDLRKGCSENKQTKYSNIIQCGDSYKEKVEAANKLLKDIRVRENIDFACNSRINIKQYLCRSNLHLDDYGISSSVRNFKSFLNDFNYV